MFCSTSFVLCMLVCSAADALVLAAGFRYNSSVHFAAAVFARGKKGKRKRKKKNHHCIMYSFCLFFVLFHIYSDASL